MAPARLISGRERPPQPGLREFPLAVHGTRRKLKKLGRFLPRQSTKKPQFYDPCLPLVNFFQTLQRLFQRQEILHACFSHDKVIVERDCENYMA